MSVQKTGVAACLCLLVVALPALARSGELALRRVLLTLGGVGGFGCGGALDGSDTIGIEQPHTALLDAIAGLEF